MFLQYVIFHSYKDASELLRQYREARLVITVRIHVALPCVAMGVPVIFITTNQTYQGLLRVEGLTPLFHHLDLTKLKGKKDVRKWIDNFDFERPPPNPNFSKLYGSSKAFVNFAWELL